MGVQGSGCLLLGEDVYADTLMEGGSGLNSLDEAMPEDSPERYEAGTLPTPAIVGLREGVRFLGEVGIDSVSKRETELCELLICKGELQCHFSSMNAIWTLTPITL